MLIALYNLLGIAQRVTELFNDTLASLTGCFYLSFLSKVSAT